MPKARYDLSKLIKFTKQSVWEEMLDDVLFAHTSQAAEKFGLELKDLVESLADHWQANIWGCAFEDFLGQTWGGRKVVNDYIKKRGWNESTANKAYMRALSETPISLYEVSEVNPGQSMKLRDLLRNVPEVTVIEKSASCSLVNWDCIATRVVKVSNHYGISGALLIFDFDMSNEIKDLYNTLYAEWEDIDPDFSGSIGEKETEILKASAHLFTNIWLSNYLNKAQCAANPKLINADGDDLEFHRIIFPLPKGVQVKSIAQKLNAAPFLESAGENFWNWFAPKRPAIFANGQYNDNVSASTQIFSTQMDDGTPVFGEVELTKRELWVDVNSRQRAQTATENLQAWLGSSVAQPRLEIRTMEQFLDDDRRRNEANNLPELTKEEAERISHAMFDQHYRAILDQPIEALSGHTPRDLATASPKNHEEPESARREVAAWLKQLENNHARSQKSDEPLAHYDITWIWEELGLEDLRQ